MPETKRRIIVDGIDFGSVVQFPKILRAVTSAAQPPRMILALLVVVALIAVGRAWDAFSGPTIAPGGLLSGSFQSLVLPWPDHARDALQSYGAELPATGTQAERTHPRVVFERLERAYRAQREALVAREAAPGELAAEDEGYLAIRSGLRAAAPRGAFDATTVALGDCLRRAVQGVFYLRPQLVYDAGLDLFVHLPGQLWAQARLFVIVYGLFFAVVLGVGGGALCRMAACDFAGQERLRVRDAVDFALGHWVKLVMTPLLPLLIAGGLALVIVGLGVLLAPWIDVVGGLLYGLSLLFGFIVVFLLVGYAMGFALLIPAVACENCDTADAQQRAYAYILNRPLHLIGYAVTAVVGLALGYLVVSLVATLTLNITAALAGLTTGNSALLAAGGMSIFDLTPTSPGGVHASWHSTAAAGFIGFWQRIVIDLVAAYVIAYLTTSATIVYLLMRRACDGQDVEEIWRPGLAPGTLVPLPNPRVDVEAPLDDD